MNNCFPWGWWFWFQEKEKIVKYINTKDSGIIFTVWFKNVHLDLIPSVVVVVSSVVAASVVVVILEVSKFNYLMCYFVEEQEYAIDHYKFSLKQLL